MAPFDHTRGQKVVRHTLQALAVVLGLWIVVSGAFVFAARSKAVAGIDRLDQARARLNGAALLRGKGQPALRASRKDFEAAHDRASSAVLAPWSVVPFVSDNTDSVEALTAGATTIASVAERAAAASAAALRASPATGPERLALLGQLEQIMTKAARGLERIDAGPTSGLVGPLRDARDQFMRQLARMRGAIKDARAVAVGAQQLLAGPRRYLLIAANNGEMRAGSGMLLSAGVASFANGGFSVSDMRPTLDFNLPPGAVPLPPQLAALWGWLTPSEEWRNLATTPRFDVTAPLAAEMWRAATGEQVDGVLVVDPVTLQALLAAQGPVDVAGHTTTAADVVQFLLLDQYEGLTSGDSQGPRRDQLSAVAGAAVETLTTRPWKVADLVQQLSDVGRGRHILAWSRDPVEQSAWKAAGIDGALRPSSIAVSLLNVGANKLDQFLDVDATLRVYQTLDGGHEVRIGLRIRNNAPVGLPGYVAGPDPTTDLAEGEYQGILAVNVPGAASPPETDAPEGFVVRGTDGPTKVLGTGFLRIARGVVRTVTVTFRLPAGISSVRVESSARVPPITWHRGSTTWQDTRAERQEW